MWFKSIDFREKIRNDIVITRDYTIAYNGILMGQVYCKFVEKQLRQHYNRQAKKHIQQDTTGQLLCPVTTMSSLEPGSKEDIVVIV